MASSVNSMSRSLGRIGEEGDESPEESSWTMYFEDFSKNNNTDMNGNSSFLISDHVNYPITSSLVSDAASSAARRHVFGASLDHKSYNRNKKMITKGAAGLVDDELEDTASSPANSPKVCDLLVNHFDKNRKQKSVMNIPHQEIKGSDSGQIIEKRNDELGFIERENDGTELKKRGLCLVPLSMVVQYFG